MIIRVSLVPAELVAVCQGTDITTGLLCNRHNTVPLGALVLGVSVGGIMSKNAIRLPVCSCGTQCDLHRNWDVLPAMRFGRQLHGTFFDLHRRMINALAQYLKAQGQIHPACLAEINAEVGTPSDLCTLPADISSLVV